MAPVIRLQLSFVKSKGYFLMVAWQCIQYFGHSWCISVFGFSASLKVEFNHARTSNGAAPGIKIFG